MKNSKGVLRNLCHGVTVSQTLGLFNRGFAKQKSTLNEDAGSVGPKKIALERMHPGSLLDPGLRRGDGTWIH